MTYQKVAALRPGEGRFKNIDVLRGIAALAVLWLHSSEVLVTIPTIRTSGTFAYDLAAFLQLGRAGVIAFFAISGFVIASTIRGPQWEGTAQFAVKRLFRLYPAYWLALAASYLFIWLPQNRIPDVQRVLANVTMLPTLFGVENAMGHFWTLEVEFLFYLLVVVLFLSGRLHSPRLVAGLACVLALKPAGYIAGKLTWAAGQGHWGEVPTCLAIMLWGSLLRSAYDPRATPGANLKAWRTGPIVLSTVFVVGRAAGIGGLIKGTDTLTYLAGLGTLWGLLLFAGFALSSQRWPRFLVWLGTISYSTYLFHPVVLYPMYFFLLAHPQYATGHLGIWVVSVGFGTVALASVTYLLIEAPANRLASRLAHADSSPQRWHGNSPTS